MRLPKILAVAALTLAAMFPASAFAERAHGEFETVCFYSHTLSDDAIVFPGQPGASHSHDFIGNRTTNAFSTPDSLRAGTTNCPHYAPSTGRKGDTAGYWHPTLIVNGLPVHPSRVTAYYTVDAITRRDFASIKPFPDQLKVIAGSASGNTDRSKVDVSCATAPLVAGTLTTPPTCAEGSPLMGRVRFPDCSDGRDDSADHKAHMAYSSSTGACPSTHPVLMPVLRLEITWPTQAGPSTHFSSGGIDTLHADFMNGWDPTKLAQLVHDCLNVDEYCGGRDAPVNPL